ncbi:hypothetical protein [Pseudomonas anguilliseptica]|uniref:hypothetical protein n=1 Tax=Pseudomonas anguilliseptica TaxID=53406 RepID=UPI003735B8D0
MDDEHVLLIDCGLFQGGGETPEGRVGVGKMAIDCSQDGIKAQVAVRVYIHHVGCISCLLTAGFRGQTLCGGPSIKLLPIVLKDAFKLGFSRDQKQVDSYLKLIDQRIVALPYRELFSLIGTHRSTCGFVCSVLATFSVRPTSKLICITPRQARENASYILAVWGHPMRHSGTERSMQR